MGQPRGQTKYDGVMRRRRWKWTDTIVATLLLIAVVSGLALLIAWDVKRGCLVWGTGHDAGFGGWRSFPMCFK